MRLAVLALALLPAVAHANVYDGNDIHNMCRTDRPFVQGYTAGFLDKATDDVGIASEKLPGEMKLISLIFTIERYCLPKNAKLGQAVDVYCKFLSDRPADRHKPATILMNQAFAEAWPCPK